MVANPADASAQASDAGTAKLTVAEASTPGGDDFAWDFSSPAFSDLITRLTAAGSTGLTDLDETIDGLRILSGGSHFRGGTSSGVSYIQTGGKGTASVRSFFVHGFRFWQAEGRGFEYRQQCRYGRACRDGSDR